MLRSRGELGSRPTHRTAAHSLGRGAVCLLWGGDSALTVDDERGPLGGLLPRLDSVLVDCILNLLQLLQCIQIRGFPLFLQFFADVGVTGEAAGSLCNLGLNGKFSFQAFQLSFLWAGGPWLILRGHWAGGAVPLTPAPARRPASLPHSWGTRVLGTQPSQCLAPTLPDLPVVLLLKSLAAGALGTLTFGPLAPVPF